MKFNKVAGVAVAAAAVAAVILFRHRQAEPDFSAAVRPVRSLVVKSGVTLPDLTFAGIVKARESRTLAFKQSGRIQRIPVAAGQKMKRGDKLAWLDPLDFENDLTKAEAAEQRDRLTFQRMSEAIKKNAVSREEVSKADAQLRQAEAQLKLAKRALEETVLYAPFDCTVAEVPATELDMANPSKPIVVIQDTSLIDIDVGVPETFVIAVRYLKPKGEKFVRLITFDSMPGKSFPVNFKEYKAAADIKTQTYTATYTMPAPEELLILPGMSATITIKGDSYSSKLRDTLPEEAVTVPEVAVGIAADGTHFVWTLVCEGDAQIARRRAIKVLLRSDNGLVVTGLKPGERIATAGVTVLTEGRRVTLLKD